MFEDIEINTKIANAQLSIGYKVMQRDQKIKHYKEYKLNGIILFYPSWGANQLSTVQDIKSIKKPLRNNGIN